MFKLDEVYRETYASQISQGATAVEAHEVASDAVYEACH